MADELILHLDTATEACSVCLSEGMEVLACREAEEPLSHTSMLTVLIEDALKGSGKSTGDLRGVSVGIGPGSYTGLRVGLSTAKGLCFSLNVPLIAVSSLEGLAHGAAELYRDNYEAIIPMIDARRMEVYAAVYDNQLERKESAKSIVLTEEVLNGWSSRYGRCLAAGNGATKCGDLRLEDADQFKWIPLPSRAEYLIKPAWKRFKAGYYSDIAYTEPVYLKPPHITKSRKTLF